MSHHDRGPQASFAGQTGGPSPRDRLLIAVALIGLGGVLVVSLASLVAGNPTGVVDDRSVLSPGPVPSAASPIPPGPWRADAIQHRGADGQGFDYECPANGVPGTIWGTLIYMDYSSVCTAAVHHGVITREEGVWWGS